MQEQARASQIRPGPGTPGAQIQVHARTETEARACSAYDLSSKLREGFIDALAGFSARAQDGPVFGRQTRIHLRIEFPIIDEIAFVHHKNERDSPNLFASPLFQLYRFIDSRSARAIRDQEIAGRPLKVRPTDFLEVIIAIKIPEHQIDLGAVDAHYFLIDLHSDSGVVSLRKDAFDEAPHQTCLTDRKRTQHANLFLNHGWLEGGTTTRNVALRLN